MIKMIEKEVSDALHVLLHCALKDKEYETQKEQFNFVYDYIFKLENNWNELNKFIDENLKSLEEKATNKISDNTLAICGSEMNGFYKVRRKMQELEGNNDL